jgi:asparagine synthase (glutamine-hydrolysing)
VSGILGVWNRNGAPIDADLLSRMADTQRHRGPDGEGRRVAGPVAFLQQHLCVTPAHAMDRTAIVASAGVMVVMDGRLDDRDQLGSALALSPSVTDAACVLAAYVKWGEDFAEHLKGDFAVGIYDAPAGRLLLARDAIGVRPLYYFVNDHLFAFASEIKALLEHPAVPVAPDDDGLADVMLPASRPVDRQEVTCFAGISAVVPAHLVVVTPGRFESRRYWDFDCGLAIHLKSYGEYAEAFREQFGRAVARRLRTPGTVAVSVSGGFDSSAIFCQAETLRREGVVGCASVKGISYLGGLGTDADERQYLLDLEREYGVVVERFPMEPLRGLVSGAREQVHANEAPVLDAMWGVTRELHVRAARTGARTLLTGHWGDQVLFSSAYLVDLFLTLKWSEVRQHVSEYARWLGRAQANVLARRLGVEVGRSVIPAAILPPVKWLRRRLVPGLNRRPSSLSVAFLQRALRFADQPVMLGHDFHSAHARSIYLEARSKYHVHCLDWNNKVAALHGMDTAFPYLDRDLLQFLMAVPGAVQNRNGVPRALAREAMRDVLPEPVRLRRSKADFTAVINCGATDDADELRRVLSPGALAVGMGYFDPATVTAEVNDHLAAAAGSAGCIESWSLAELFALEAWLQVFLGRTAAGAAGGPEAMSARSASHTADRPDSVRG